MDGEAIKYIFLLVTYSKANNFFENTAFSVYFLVRPVNTEEMILCHLHRPTWQSLRKVRVGAAVEAVGRGSPTPTRTSPRTRLELSPRPPALGPQGSPRSPGMMDIFARVRWHLQPHSSCCL